MIDHYCERISAGILAEPANALTNISFLIAFFYLLPLSKSRFQYLAAGERIILIALLGLLVTIAFGSTAFHTLANRWSLMADVIPISLFQLVFLGGYLRYVAKVSLVFVALALIGFLISGAVLGRLSLGINGSESYLAPLAFIAAMGVYHKLTAQNGSWMLLLTTAVFVCSLGFRTIDNAICSTFPIGTHFLWHVINGLVLFLCIKVFLLCAGEKDERFEAKLA